MSLLNVNKIAPQSGTDFTLGDSGDTFTVPSGATLTVAGTFTQTGAQTFDGGVDIDNFNINGTTIALSSGDMTLDVAGDIVLDADGGDVFVKDAGTTFGSLTNTSGNLIIKSGTTAALTFSGANVTAAGTLGVTGVTTSNAGVVVDNITIDGTEIDLSSGSLTVDVAGDIILDSGDGVVKFQEAGSDRGRIYASGSNVYLKSDVSDKDLIFQGNDGGAGITALTLDMSAAGKATFNDGLVATTLTLTGITSLPDGASGAGNLAILNTGDTDTGIYFPAANTIAFECGAESLRLAEQKLSTNAETSPDVSSGGLCLDMNAADANILTFKSSDVGHLMVDNAEADTFGKLQKADSGAGGIEVQGFTESAQLGLKFAAFTTGAMPTAKSTSVRGSNEFTAYIRDGNGATASITDNGNIFNIRAGNTTRFIFDEDGDFHADNSSNTFDAYDDAQLVRAYDLSHGRGVIDSKFDKFVSYNHEKLADLELVGREEDGTPNHFVNVCGMQRLHNGAIWQQYEKHERLLEAVYDLAKESIGEEKAKAILEKHEVKRLN